MPRFTEARDQPVDVRQFSFRRVCTNDHRRLTMAFDRNYPAVMINSLGKMNNFEGGAVALQQFNRTGSGKNLFDH
ncbi:hypothetical protein D3C73_887910 [compost metagenome]